MRFYEAASTIVGSPEQVWKVLVDGVGWSEWDSGVDSVEGTIAMGGKLKIRSQAAPGRAFPVTVTVFEPSSRLELTGGMPLGLFRGIRTYDVTGTSSTATAFRVREEYTGPLLPMIWKSMPDLGPSFEQFAAGLKSRVESGA